MESSQNNDKPDAAKFAVKISICLMVVFLSLIWKMIDSVWWVYSELLKMQQSIVQAKGASFVGWS